MKTKLKHSTKSFISHLFAIASIPLALFGFFCVSFSSIIFIISDTNYRNLLLCSLHFATTLSHYKTPCITGFSFIYYFQYLYANYQHLLLSSLHFPITSSCYSRTCNILYNNYVINICPKQLL